MTTAPAQVRDAAELTYITGCTLSPSPDAVRQARRFTRHTLASWGLGELADDAELVVTELLANAIRHAWPPAEQTPPAAAALALWLLGDTDGLMCVVTDPSNAAPVLGQPGPSGEDGRGLQIVHALSDHWGWSALSQQGKAVWTVLFQD